MALHGQNIQGMQQNGQQVQGVQEVMQGSQQGGLGNYSPNSSLELINLKREQDRESMSNSIRQDERARIQAENANNSDIQRQILASRAQGFDEGANAIASDLGLQGRATNVPSQQRQIGPAEGQDLNSYLSDGIRNGTLAPEEAMAAVNEPSVSPEIRKVLSQALGSTENGLGTVPTSR